MILKFVERFETAKPQLRERFREKPGSYAALVKAVIEAVTDHDDYGDHNPDPERIHEIDDGHYQGTLVYVIGAKGYQPSDYWYVRVGYGSCSGCDTLEAISEYSDDPATESQIDDYMTLALHIVQGLHQMGGEEA
jgi:hypothetical protein